MNQDFGHTTTPGGWWRLGWSLTWRAAVNPALALDLLTTVWAFRRRHWWRRPPFLPIPSRDYLRWRMYTAYGSEDAIPSLHDVMRFARWRRRLLAL